MPLFPNSKCNWARMESLQSPLPQTPQSPDTHICSSFQSSHAHSRLQATSRPSVPVCHPTDTAGNVVYYVREGGGVARQRGTHIEAIASCSHPGSHRPRGDTTYWNALGLQDEAGHVSSRQTKADGIANALHEVRLESVPRRHLQKQDYPLFAIPVVLGYTQAIFHLIEGFHCGGRKKNSFAQSSPQATML